MSVEDTYCPDVFVSGVDHIEKLEGGMVRVVFYSERVEPDGEKVRTIVCRIVRPVVSIVPATRLFMQVLGESGMAFIAEAGHVMPMN